MDYKISVIVPIYNVEPFIERCAHSLLGQTLDNIEYIFVDDKSPDNSIGVLNDVIVQYPHRHEAIKIIRHEVNKGLPCARNTGLREATGRYIFHCDSDDFLETNAFEELYLKADGTGADLVWCDWFLTYESNERYMKQQPLSTVNPINYLKEILSGRLKYNVWNKLVKRELYLKNNIIFPDGMGMGEDMTMIKLIAVAKSVEYIPKAFYHYVRYNASAYTSSMNEKHTQQMLSNAKNTIEFLESKYGNELNSEINYFKLSLKLPFLISLNKNSYKVWNKLYPEANYYILNNDISSKRTKLLEYLASKKLYGCIWLYNVILYKIIYRLKYIKR